MVMHVNASATPLKNWLRLPLPNTMNLPFETISIVGLGYIGLPTAAVFASPKVKVISVDVKRHALDTINRGQIHIIEPDLDMVVHAAVSEGYLRATTRPEPADAFLIAVPTPLKRAPPAPPHDMDYIESASKSVAAVLKAGDHVILESTSPVGATEQMAAWLAEARPDFTFPQTHGESSDIRIAHCPKRVLPGQVLCELIQNDRAIGGMTPRDTLKNPTSNVLQPAGFSPSGISLSPSPFEPEFAPD